MPAAAPSNMTVYARYAILGGNEENKVEPIEIEKWEPHPEKPGYLKYTGNRTIGEIFTDLRKRLKEEGLLPDEYFDVFLGVDKNASFPVYAWIACYPVTGSNEGHYIHINAMAPREIGRETLIESKLIYLGKTFQGLEFASKVAAACAKHLGA
ncbi:hypothetical protein [Desulfoscipio geothermicus]|uniref:Uncharacterized protein n=1 Tax=Desulfoscipio geothermicus DSM 3669 TaxID=1121426 RepID=A0A1I6E4J5_9FIRM|nr:hypothetical protein [Desulfoscipio geothermicus]SFR12472.1 hypothetical protein SAMN05660706_12534 [Desulfoscipio geothermicus DSM 3669]